MLETIPDSKNIDKAISDGLAQLRSENEPFPELEAIRESARLYEIERMDRSNISLQRLRDEIIAFLQDNKSRGKRYPSLVFKMNDVIRHIKSNCALMHPTNQDPYLKAIVIVEGWYV